MTYVHCVGAVPCSYHDELSRRASLQSTTLGGGLFVSSDDTPFVWESSRGGLAVTSQGCADRGCRTCVTAEGPLKWQTWILCVRTYAHWHKVCQVFMVPLTNVEGMEPASLKRDHWAAPSANRSTRQLSKSTQGSSQTRKARFQIDSPLDTNSSGDDEPKNHNPEGYESWMTGMLGCVQDARPATQSATHLSKAAQASDKPHLNTHEYSHINPLFSAQWALFSNASSMPSTSI